MVVFISEDIETLKAQLNDKDSKLKNQAAELDHLTNKVIPELKKDNKYLKSIKIELTDALESSTKKYFDQLEINADLSESVAKKGAALQLSKVRIEEIEKLVAELEAEASAVKKEAVAEVETVEDKIKNFGNSSQDLSQDALKEIESLKDKIFNLENKLKAKDKDLKQKDKDLKNIKKDYEKSDDIINRLQFDVEKLNKSLKEKEEALKATEGLRGQIAKLEAELKASADKLDNKIREYDKLSTSVKAKDKTINSLKARNEDLIAEVKASSKKGGFFSRFK